MQSSINGILLLDKPLHLSSNKALQRIKRLFNAEKAGHTGSLDPLATGMLPICLGEATKFSQFLLDADKHYFVEAQLGMKTTTGDAEGEVIATTSAVHITQQHLKNALLHFTGNIQQIPPMHSALKHAGKPLYVLARKGIEVEREPRAIKIYAANFVSFENNIFSFSVHCSKGTYIRTLVEDIGEYLNCGAYVKTLRRTAIDAFSENKMVTFSELEKLSEKNDAIDLQNLLLPIDSGIQSLPAVSLSPAETYYLFTGRSVTSTQPFPANTIIRLYAPNQSFVGVGQISEDNQIKSKRLISHSPLAILQKP